MHGTVWEWCSDLYSPSYIDEATQDPIGPKTDDCPVLRGGSWAYPRDYSRSATRLIGSPIDIADGGTVGFRIVVEDDKP